MFADDALKIIFSHPAATAGIGGLVGGGGALVYNAFSKPTLDEYGNPIEPNDINPFVAAGIGSGIGLVGGMGMNYLKGRNPVQPSQAGRQTPQEVVSEPVTMYPQKMPKEDAEYPYETYWEQSKTNNNPQQEAAIVRVRANPMDMQNPMSPPGMKPIIISKPKESGQEMMEEALRLKMLAEQQRLQRQVHARASMALDGYDVSRPGWMQTNYPEDRQQNAAGWDLIDPSPESNAWNRELNSDAIRYQKWLESEAIARDAQKKIV